MPDMDMVKEILKQILNALQKIQWRFAPVNSADEFTDTPQGMEKLDSICMLLIAVGESCKKNRSPYQRQPFGSVSRN